MPSRKPLTGVVRSLVESFTSLMNYHGDDYVMGHIVFASWRSGATKLTVNLLDGTNDKSPLLVPEVVKSIGHYVGDLRSLIERSNSDLKFVSSAELLVTVDPHTKRQYADTRLEESPFTCTVRISDDRGKVYAHTVSSWWFPEKVAPRA